MFKKYLSSALWALKKWTSIDSQLWKFPISQDMWAVALASTTAVHAAVTLWTWVTTTVTTAITSPVTYRALTITWNQAGITWTVVVTWTDWAGRTITESIVASWTATVSWNIPFKTVNKIVFPARNAASDTIAIWTSTKLGLYRDIAVSWDVLTILVDWVRETPATVNVANWTVITTTAQNGTRIFEIPYLTSNF